MIGSFRKSFKPTESDREAKAVRYLNLLIDSIQNKSCITCKYSLPAADCEHGKITSRNYCTRLGAYGVYTKCAGYRLSSLNLILGGKSQGDKKDD